MPAVEFMQATPATTPTTTTPSAPTFNIDLSGLADGMWNALTSHMNGIATAAWTSFSQWLYSLLRGMFLGIWNATLLPIPHSVTDQFSPVQTIFAASTTIAAAGVVLAVVLLGLRTIVRGITGRGGILDEIMGRLLVYASVLSMLPWIISHAIDIEQKLAMSIAIGSLATILPAVTPAANPLSLVLMLLCGLRLWLKLASNVVHVAVAVAWAPVAMFCGLMPETAWVASLWTREFVGRLAGAVLATLASAIGLGLVLTGSGDFAVFGVAGAFNAAADLVDWLARTPGSGMGGMLGMGMRLGMGMMGGGGAAALPAIPANQLTTVADRYGYD